MLISVIMPTYNSLKILQKSLPAILTQKQTDDFDYEVILINDGSTDSTSLWLKTLSNNRLKVINLKENKGRSIARNLGIKKAKGDIYLFLDSDVIASSNLIQEHLKTLKVSKNGVEVPCLVSSGFLINIYDYNKIELEKAKLRDLSSPHFATGICSRHLK